MKPGKKQSNALALNHALSRCFCLVRLFQRSLLLLLTENAVTTLLGHNGLSGAAKDGV